MPFDRKRRKRQQLHEPFQLSPKLFFSFQGKLMSDMMDRAHHLWKMLCTMEKTEENHRKNDRKPLKKHQKPKKNCRKTTENHGKPYGKPKKKPHTNNHMLLIPSLPGLVDQSHAVPQAEPRASSGGTGKSNPKAFLL